MAVFRLPLRSKPPRTAFVLGGGGNLGSIQVGMLQALMERGHRPDLLLGCSVGALNATAIATDPTPVGVARLRDLWLRLGTTDVFPSGLFHGPWALARKGDSLYPNDGLQKMILTWLTSRRFEDALVPVQVVAVSLRTGQERWFHTGDMVKPLLASAALPAVFPPVDIDGEMFIDGGVLDNVPIQRAVDLGAKRVFVLHVGNFERERPEPKRPIDVLVQAFAIARAYRFHRESNGVYGGVELITLPGLDPGSLKYNDFSRSEELIERARQVTAEFLDSRDAAAAR